MTPKDPAPDKNDVLQAQINVSMAEVRDIVSTWISSQSTNTSLPQSPLEHALDDHSEDFRPPRLGLGAPIPPDWAEGHQKLHKDSINDQLRRKILGSSRRKPKNDAPQVKNHSVARKDKRIQRGHRVHDSESDVDIGRSSIGKSKCHKVQEVGEKVGESDGTITEANNEGNDNSGCRSATHKTQASLDSSQSSPRRIGTFLDEYTAQSALKKKRKKRNKKSKKNN